MPKPVRTRFARARSRPPRPEISRLHELLLSGLEALKAGNLDEAVATNRAVLELAPDSFEAHTNLAIALSLLRKAEEAAASFERARALRPDDPSAHNNLGNALRRLGKTDAAIGCYQGALALEPDYVEAHSNLGAALVARGRTAEGIASCQQALALDPDNVPGLTNLGNALLEQGRVEEAVATLERLIALRPDDAPAHNNLGIALGIQGRAVEAAATLERAIALRPDDATAYGNLGKALKAQGRLDEALAVYRRALTLAPEDAGVHDNLLVLLLYMPALDPAVLLAEPLRWDVQHGLPLARHVRPHANDPKPRRPLRIGYVSPDFREHAVSHFFLPVIEHHDRREFEVVCYSNASTPDAMTARLRSLADAWRDIAGLDDADVAERIRADGIDVLVDLACHTGGNRLRVFARKPAPVQVTQNVVTSGLSAIDYLVTDVHLAPGLPDGAVAETLLRLPECFTCYAPPPEAPAVAPPPALASGSVTFGSFNNVTKLTGEVVALWARVLDSVPGSRLLLKSSFPADAATHRRLQAEFERCGIEGDRVELLAKTPTVAEHLRLYARMDVALDPFPFNGCTTTCEALWMGVPVVTLAGSLFVDRVGVSLLSAAGLPQLVAATADEYVRLAVALASDLENLATIRARLRAHLAASALCDGARFTGVLEAGYREIWRRWCAGAGRGEARSDAHRFDEHPAPAP